MWKDEDNLPCETKEKFRDDNNQFHWHVRAFFWELVATIDTIFQWANQRFVLNIPETSITWSTIVKNVANANKDQAEWGKKFAILQVAIDSDWYYEIRQYRNFAHRSFIFINAEYDGHYGKRTPTLRIIRLTPARDGQQECVDLVTNLSNYSEKIRQLIEDIFDT